MGVHYPYECSVMINSITHSASCAKGTTQVWNLIVVRMFNEGIVRMVISMDWCGLSKDIKFICNSFTLDWIVELYRAT
jgi:hypothetical protein